MIGGIPFLVPITMPMVDVQSVAKAHFESVKRDEANGKRFILVGNTLMFTEIAQILKDKYGEHYPVRTAQLWRCVLQVFGCCSSGMRNLNSMWNKPFKFDGEPAAQILGVEYIGAKESLIEMGDSLIRTGYVEDKRP